MSFNTPVDTVLQNYTGSTGKKDISTIVHDVSKKWNKRYLGQWPIGGTLDRESLKAMQTKIQDYKSDENNGTKRKSRAAKRQRELEVLELFFNQSQRTSKDAADTTQITPQSKEVSITAPISEEDHKSPSDVDFLPAAATDRDPMLVAPKTGLETTNEQLTEYLCQRYHLVRAEDENKGPTVTKVHMGSDRVDSDQQEALIDTLISVGQQLDRLTMIFEDTVNQLVRAGAFRGDGRVKETCPDNSCDRIALCNTHWSTAGVRESHHGRLRRACQVDNCQQMDTCQETCGLVDDKDPSPSRGVSSACRSQSNLTPSVCVQAPVILKDKSVTYKPWNNMDIVDIESRLPPLQQGGATWINRLEEVTKDKRLTMGDFKELLSGLVGGPTLADLLSKAGLSHYMDTAESDADLYILHRGLLSRALREKYPTNVDPQDVLIAPLGQTECPRSYVKRANDTWKAFTGNDPEKTLMDRYILREKIQQGLPDSTSFHLESVVCLRSMPTPMYIDCIEHHVRLDRRRMAAQTETEEEKERELRALTLEHMREEKKMRAAETAANTGHLQTVPVPAMITGQNVNQPVAIPPGVDQFYTPDEYADGTSYQPFRYRKRKRIRRQASYAIWQQQPPAVKLKGPCYLCGERSHFWRQCRQDCPPWRRGPRQREMQGQTQVAGHEMDRQAADWTTGPVWRSREEF